MAESPILLVSKARELLTASSFERFEILLNQLSSPEETLEFQSSLTLFNFCASKFPNCLTLILLEVYQSCSNEIARFQSIHLLSSTLDVFRTRETHLSLAGLEKIKPLLISCLEMQDSETKVLGKIVSFVAHDVDGGEWDELGDCILSFAKTQPLKAFHVFIELPRVNRTFIEKFMQKVVEEAEKVLLNPPPEEVEDWSLGLETLVKMGVQNLDSSETISSLVKNLLSVLVKSVEELVKKGMEEFVIQGLENLERFLSRDKVLYGYNKNQCLFVSSFMYQIRELGTKIREITRTINRMIRASNNPQEESQDPGDGGCFERLNKLSMIEIARIFVLNDEEERVKDMAIRRLNLLLSKQNPKRNKIPVSVVRCIQSLLVSWLSKEGISESMFKVLGEVVYNVADWMMNVQEETWFDIRDYIVSQSETEFQRAVYIFQCLRLPLDEKEFVIPVMENLLPEIITRLNPPSDVLVDNSWWVLAFGGAFCAVIHLIDMDDHNETVKEIAYKMIDSVRELVEKEMEVGLVRRAFRDVESSVKKHLEWFTSSEYKFVKGMVWKLYEIKGMKMETKLVLWRINFRLERGVAEQFKEQPKSDLDWLNQLEEDEED